MLSDAELEKLFVEWKTPAAGRTLIRKIRTEGPVRNLQYRMDGIRTRLISSKMGGRALYAESRTCEYPALYIREHDPETVEYWPQPCTIDLMLKSGKGSTRLQHTPDLFVIQNGFIIEEWRERARLVKLAAEHPDRFYCDVNGKWHYVQFEEHFKELGIEYRLRCSDEHPRVYLANLRFLEDFSLESAPPVPNDVRQRLTSLLKEHIKLPHLALIEQHEFSADHIFQLVAEGAVFVDLHAVQLRDTGSLIIYRDKLAWRLHEEFRPTGPYQVPSSALVLAVGGRYSFDGRRYEIALLGETQVTVRDLETKALSTLSIEEVGHIFDANRVEAGGSAQYLPPDEMKTSLFNEKRMAEALNRLDSLRAPDAAIVTDRTLRRWTQRVAGLTAPQDQLDALVSRNPGNTSSRLPEDVLALAERAVEEFHNRANNPTTSATYNFYVTLCTEAQRVPMSQAQFYRWVKKHEDRAAREGKRKDYQKKPIPEYLDFGAPVHGVLPHEVCYCDHTIMNVMLKGSVMPDLGKPTITLMADGALSKARAFYLSYRPASAVSVLMCLRDYVRRNGRLPRMLVLDNGREFHSAALKLFCSLFRIDIRWRRRSRPRDSSIIERMLGATEQEIISQLDGNSIALKDPRMVSSTHLPHKHIKWTLPGLHHAVEYFLFEVHAKRIHPRFGISPENMEQRMNLEFGARSHMLVRFDEKLKLLTASHSGKATRVIDRQRGVFVDGYYYWNDVLAQAKLGEVAEVRVELWRARVVYVCFRGEWHIAIARDAGVLEGRFRPELELQLKEEGRARRAAANKDRTTAVTSAKRTALWRPDDWDQRMREQMAEMHGLYERLGMTEVLPAAKNAQGAALHLGLPRGSELEMLEAIENEHTEERAEAESLPSADIPQQSPASKPKATKSTTRSPASKKVEFAASHSPAPTPPAQPAPSPPAAPPTKSPTAPSRPSNPSTVTAESSDDDYF